MRDLMARIAEEIPALRRYARCLLRDADSADDLVQDCLERALARRHLWRRGGSLRSWLFTILHTLHVNQQRNRRRRPMLVALDEDQDIAAGADPLSRIEAREILAAFHRLAEEQREALLLIVVEGVRYREAARILGVPEGTVVSRVSRARTQLRGLAGAAAPRLRRVK